MQFRSSPPLPTSPHTLLKLLLLGTPSFAPGESIVFSRLPTEKRAPPCNLVGACKFRLFKVPTIWYSGGSSPAMSFS